MKAILCTAYGPAEVMELREVAKPQPKADEILIKIHESLATPTDVASRSGKPFLIRFFSGLLRPKGILGSDLAGVVEAVGANVTRFKPGDRVFGAASPQTGTYAEYICLGEERVITTLPDSMSFAESAGICDGGLTALTFLRDVARIQPGDSLLINGASGSVGTYAVQLGKHFGAHVTGVCSGKNAELVAGLGADVVIDYTQTDFTQAGEQYDIIFDAVGKSSFLQSKAALKPGGIYLTTVPSWGIPLYMAWTALFGSKKAKFAATGLTQNREKLEYMKQLLLRDELKSVIGSRYPLTQIVEAHQLIETGHKTGNVVIDVV